MMKCDFAKGDTWRKSEDSISPAYSFMMYNTCICVSFVCTDEIDYIDNKLKLVNIKMALLLRGGRQFKQNPQIFILDFCRLQACFFKMNFAHTIIPVDFPCISNLAIKMRLMN